MKSRGRTWTLETATERVTGGMILSLRGRISSATAASFASAMAAARAETPNVVIDLEEVDYISGPGVAVLREVATGSGPRAILCGLQEPVRITLELAGALDDIVIEDTRGKAIGKLGE